MTIEENEMQIRQAIATLKQKHRYLDDTISTLEASQSRDQLSLTRMKRQKLTLKDEITRLEDRLLPNIIA